MSSPHHHSSYTISSTLPMPTLAGLTGSPSPSTYLCRSLSKEYLSIIPAIKNARKRPEKNYQITNRRVSYGRKEQCTAFYGKVRYSRYFLLISYDIPTHFSMTYFT